MVLEKMADVRRIFTVALIGLMILFNCFCGFSVMYSLVTFKPASSSEGLPPWTQQEQLFYLDNFLVKLSDRNYFKGEKVFESKGLRTLDEAVRGSDCILIGTDHEEFKNLDLERLAKLVNMPAAMVDTRGIASPIEVKKHGFSYRGIGRTS